MSGVKPGLEVSPELELGCVLVLVGLVGSLAQEPESLAGNSSRQQEDCARQSDRSDEPRQEAE